MKIYILIYCVFLTANLNLIMAQEEFTEDWEKVEAFDKKGLPKSALDIVKTINNKAKKNGNTTQIIKSLLYKSKYLLTLEENAQLKIIQDFKNEIEQHTFPERAILENMLANLYWQYFKQNRWKFYNRTTTVVKVDPKDFRTWDLETLFKETHLYFQKSLENEVLAQQTKLSKFDAILLTNEGSKKYRPTLYDFLSHNALEFYKTSETSITKPTAAFELDSPEYFKPAAAFSKLKIETKDSLSLQYQALKIYQNLLIFHLQDSEPDALVAVDMERFKFIKEHAVFYNKDASYLEGLRNTQEKYTKNPVATMYAYEIADFYREQADGYVPIENTIHQWKFKKAIEICDAAIKAFPNARGAKNCMYLKEKIWKPQIDMITIEEFIPIRKASRLLVTYKNLNHLYFKILKINNEELTDFNKIYEKSEQLAFLKNRTVVTAWKADLKNEKDYQNHATEVIVPSLEQGTYMIVGSPEDNFNKNGVFTFGNFQVTDLTLVQNHTEKGINFQVLHRFSGTPITNAKIELSSNNKRNTLNKTLITDTNGGAVFSEQKNHYNITATVRYKNDTAYFDGLHLNSNFRTNTENEAITKRTTFLFTDRSIYRPGQTVFFKGIILSSKGKETPKVVADKNTFVQLIDVNGQQVAELTFKTNAYGSFTGEFILPSSGLTGMYTIRTENYQSTSISVEEYKRPKFEASFKPVTKTYKAGDQITINGTALAYAGSTITDAKVLYRVQRKVQYPSWCYWYPRYTVTPQEITHGETKTNDLGEFNISFDAIPDTTVDKKKQPIFTYQVTADVIDINGETRTATSMVNVGYHTLKALITTKEIIKKDAKEHSFTVSTQNLNNEPIANTGTIEIFKLQTPDQPLRDRPWDAPDYQIIDKEDFKKQFPHDAYKDEDDYKNWKKGKLVFETIYTTKIKDTEDSGIQKIDLNGIAKWNSGAYIMELHTKDRFGQEVKDLKYFNVLDTSDKTIPDHQLFEITANKETYSVGEEVLLKLSSSARDFTVILDIEKSNRITETQIIILSNASKTIKIPVTKEDLGGFAISYSFVKYNGYKSRVFPIAVPLKPTALSIVTKTFRDKLKPGQKESWSFTIEGPKGDKVTAELLASMYDASLDQFRPHQWSFNAIHPYTFYPRFSRNANASFRTTNVSVSNQGEASDSYRSQNYDALNWFGFSMGNANYGLEFGMMRAKSMAPMSSTMKTAASVAEEVEIEGDYIAFRLDDSASGAVGNEVTPNSVQQEKEKETILTGVTIRKNLQETAFFYPQMTTDTEGNVSFNFTAPEALTKWKLQMLAHTKEGHTAAQTFEAVTQKELMVLPNPPRFLRQGDQIVFSAKISNVSDTNLSGVVTLQLVDAMTNKSIDIDLGNTHPKQDFDVKLHGNSNVSWTLKIPDHVATVQYTIVAKAKDFSDGEQNVLPVLTNRTLITETLPMWIRSDQTKTFTLDKLKNNRSKTLKNHKLTLEMTSNPAWYAVQALPYLMESPHESSENVFSRYYANKLASHITNSNPRIRQVFDQWKSTDALLSALEKNQELKSMVISETPWLRDAMSETEQKKRIALLFDLNKMKNELTSSLEKLRQMQYDSGAFPWFQGGRDNRYISQYIVAGFGHLKKLGVPEFDQNIKNMLVKALDYLDAEFVEEYEELKKQSKKNKIDLAKDHLSYTQIHYLYTRSFFKDIDRAPNTKEAWNYYLAQAKKYWLDKELYPQGLLALILQRNNDAATATAITASLQEKSIISDELGMYWKSNTNSWFWYQAPIETQSLMIEVFNEIVEAPKKTEIIDHLKIWLLKNKQTNQWKTTKATAEAVYALLSQGSDWISITDMVEIQIGKQNIDPATMEAIKVEAGTGYFKTSWNEKEIQPSMATAKISKTGEGIAWGALYWQYFEELDKITSAETPLQVSKKLFLKKNTDRGEEITEIGKNTKVSLGDIVHVRIELRADRSMEFVQMKDLRAAGLEPINVISQYKYQDGLGYYESIKDASTNFFFDFLPKGIFIFEYELRVNNKGNFSNGITTIQSMYAPAFSSHSKGVRIDIE